MLEKNTIHGVVAHGFDSVRNAFAAVAAEEGSLEAQLAAYHHGQLVVDLWTGPQMTGDTLLSAYSVSKGASHLIVALLVQEGVLDLDQRVSHYWPEFAVEGKKDILLRELLAHRAGLVGADAGFAMDELASDPIVAERLARQRPYWRPGTAFGYHALVMAALSGEVVQRATGQTVQALFGDRVRDAYAVDFHLGLSQNEEARFLMPQPALVTAERSAALAARALGADSLTGIAFNRNRRDSPQVWELSTFRNVRAFGTASFGGVASARGMARMFAAAIGPLEGRAALLTRDTAAVMAQIHSAGRDMVTQDYKAFGAGFHITSQYYPALGQGTFGHSGAGGQQAFADPRHGLAYGYTRRRFPFPSAAAPENERFIRALVAAAESRDGPTGT